RKSGASASKCRTCSSRTTGRETSASCRTSSNVPSSFASLTRCRPRSIGYRNEPSDLAQQGVPQRLPLATATRKGRLDGKQGGGTVRRAKEGWQMSARGGTSRWDGNVHYYDYEPDSVRLDTTRIEGYVVAEAFIYDHTTTTEKVAITVLATSEELEIEKLPRD